MTHSNFLRSRYLVTCTVAILFANVAAAMAKDPASDLDTLMLGAFEKSGKDSAVVPATASASKSSNRKYIAAKPAQVAPSFSTSEKSDALSAQPTAPTVASERADGLLAAIGIATPSVQRPIRMAQPIPTERGGLLAALGTMSIEGKTASATDATDPPMESSEPRSAAVVAAPQRVAAPAVTLSSPKMFSAPPAVAQQGPLSETTASIGMRANAQMPVSYNSLPMSEPDYRVDAGDKLRIVVYGQEGLTNTYAIDAGGGITMPLIGRVIARGMTPAGLAAHVTARLRKGYIREPSVAVEVETYRPFFILGEVAAPGQYPYVPNMSVEAAVAIAGGFSPRARRDSVMLTQKVNGGQTRAAVPLGTPLSPGDTIMVGERWF